jgi:hypothetical protein
MGAGRQSRKEQATCHASDPVEGAMMLSCRTIFAMDGGHVANSLTVIDCKIGFHAVLRVTFMWCVSLIQPIPGVSVMALRQAME